jgi:DNA repair protein RecO (recombination protein O)
VSLYRDDGVVLRTHKLGEADRIVVVLTRNHGKVRAVAKGVRRTKSRFGARLEPGSVLSMQLYHGRGELDIVTQAETLERYRALRDDLARYSRAAVLLEVAESLVPDRTPARPLHQLLVGALRELDRSGSALVVPAFVVKVLALEGVQPVVDRCVGCGSDGPLVAFDRAAGGTLCGSCRRGQAVTPGAVGVLGLLAAGQVRAAIDGAPPEVVAELEVLATRLAEHHLERRLRSVDVLARDVER